MIGCRDRDGVPVEGQALGRLAHDPRLLLLHVGALALLQHGLHVVSVAVDDEEGEDHEGESQQGAHHDQLIPVRLGVHLLRAGLARQDDGLLSLDVWRARVAHQSGALLARLRPHAVVGQQLAETLLFRPALVGLHPVRLSHDH